MSRSKEIIELFTQGEYSKKIQQGFDEWIVSSYCQEDKDEALQGVWDSIDVDNDESLDMAYQQTLKRIAKYEDVSKGKKKLSLVFWKAAAAVLLIPLISFIMAFLYISNNETVKTEVIPLTRCFVPNGETRKIILPDNSEVNLNSGSLLIYPERFTAESREVYLIGEGRFSVTKKDGQPFVVNTSDYKVEVLGTIFNVCSYSDDNTSSVTVKQGTVQIIVDSLSKTPFVIKPDEQIIYDRVSKSVEERSFIADIALAWEKGGILFDGQSIHEIAKMIERKYGISVYITTNKFDNARITAKFVHGENLNEFLSVFKQLIPNMTYEKNNDNVYIR